MSTSVETFSLTTLLKWVWVGILLPAYLFLFRRQEKLRDNTYTKAETDKAINSQLAPILVELKHNKISREENTSAMKELNASVNNLQILIAKIGVTKNED